MSITNALWFKYHIESIIHQSQSHCCEYGSDASMIVPSLRQLIHKYKFKFILVIPNKNTNAYLYITKGIHNDESKKAIDKSIFTKEK